MDPIYGTGMKNISLIRDALTRRATMKIVLEAKKNQIYRQLIRQTQLLAPSTNRLPKFQDFQFSTWWTFAIGRGESDSSSAKLTRCDLDPGTITLPEQSIRTETGRAEDGFFRMLPRSEALGFGIIENSASVDTVLIVGDSFLASSRTFTSD